MAALGDLQGLVVIDEIQHLPKLPEMLRVLMDRTDRIHQPGQFLLLGRAMTVEIGDFDISETGVGPEDMQQLWLRGGFPTPLLAQDDGVSLQWRQAAMQRHVSGDLSLLGMNVPAPMMMRFWQMLAHNHGQVWNAADRHAHWVFLNPPCGATSTT